MTKGLIKKNYNMSCKMAVDFNYDVEFIIS